MRERKIRFGVPAFAAALVFSSLASPALADDEDGDFSGGYAGGEVGYLSVDTDIGILGNIGGVYYGGYMGYRGQSDNRMVYGVEGYFGGASNNTTITVGSASATVDMGRIFGVDGILGYAASDKVLVFAHAGYVNAKVMASTSGIAPPVTVSDSEGGWRAGGGIEVKMSEKVNGRLKLSYGKIEDLKFFAAIAGLQVGF